MRKILYLAVRRYARRYRGTRSAGYLTLLTTLLLGISVTFIPRAIDLLFNNFPFVAEELQSMNNYDLVSFAIKTVLAFLVCYASLGPYARVLQITLPEKFAEE